MKDCKRHLFRKEIITFGKVPSHKWVCVSMCKKCGKIKELEGEK